MGNRIAKHIYSATGVFEKSPTTEDGQPDPMFEYSLNEYCKKMGLDRNMVPTTGVFETAEFINNSSESQFDASSRFVDNNDLAVVKDHAFGRFGRWVTKQKDKLNNWLNSFSSQENGYEMEGEEGLIEFKNKLDSYGSKLLLTPLAPAGVAMCAGSDIIETGLDYKNHGALVGTINLVVRGCLFAFDHALGKNIDAGMKANEFILGKRNPIEKGITDYTTDRVIEYFEDEITVDKNPIEP
jgi:hypothetical protein